MFPRRNSTVPLDYPRQMIPNIIQVSEDNSTKIYQLAKGRMWASVTAYGSREAKTQVNCIYCQTLHKPHWILPELRVGPESWGSHCCSTGPRGVEQQPWRKEGTKPYLYPSPLSLLWNKAISLWRNEENTNTLKAKVTTLCDCNKKTNNNL